jgi:cytochrome c oxidase cbb3-type subunit 1
MTTAVAPMPETSSGPNRATVDAACRPVVLVWYASAVFWLLAGSLLALLASIKLHSPYFLADYAWLTFGRVRPAHLNSMVYGWGSMAGIGTLLWLQARLSRVRLPFREALYLFAWYWNAALAYGLWGMLSGSSAGVEWLELPATSAGALSAAFVVLFAASLKMLVSRKVAHLYVSQWYLLGATFWFPFLYVAAMLLIFVVPAPGTVKAVANWWFAHNVLGLWFTPIGLATVYYLIPKVLGRPIHSYYLSILGFWTVALFYNWAGTHHLIGGPLPAWLISVGIVGSIMMFVPVVTVAINHHMTMVGHFRLLRRSPTLRFTVFGAMSYTVVSLQGSLMALRSVNQTTHFTHYTIAHAHLGVYAFYTMVMFGAFYYVMPRLTGLEWYSATLIRVHFWCTAVGMSLYFVALTWAGIFQGRQMNSSDVPFMQIVRYTVPYLQWRSVAGVLMTVGHLAFAILVAQMLLGRGRKLPGPTLFGRRQLPLFSWRRQDNPADTPFPGGLK